MDNWNEWSNHVLKSLENLSSTMRDFNKEQKKYNETLHRLTNTVEVHEMRSTRLETIVEHLESSVKLDMTSLEKSVEDDLAPLKASAEQIKGIGNAIRWIGYMCGTILGISGVYKLFELISK